MRIDAADTAEVVPGLFGVPLIERELLCAFDHAKPFNGNAGHDSALPAAQRTIALA